MKKQPRGRQTCAHADRYMDVDDSCSWITLLLFVCLIFGGNPQGLQAEQGEVRRWNISSLWRASFINSSVSRATFFFFFHLQKESQKKIIKSSIFWTSIPAAHPSTTWMRFSGFRICLCMKPCVCYKGRKDQQLLACQRVSLLLCE